jgi:hypothetical protein
MVMKPTVNDSGKPVPMFRSEVSMGCSRKRTTMFVWISLTLGLRRLPKADIPSCVLTDRTYSLRTVNRVCCWLRAGGCRSTLLRRFALAEIPFPAPCGVEQCSGRHSSASFASRQKTNWGRGDGGDHRDCSRHRKSSKYTETHEQQDYGCQCRRQPQLRVSRPHPPVAPVSNPLDGVVSAPKILRASVAHSYRDL